MRTPETDISPLPHLPTGDTSVYDLCQPPWQAAIAQEGLHHLRHARGRGKGRGLEPRLWDSCHGYLSAAALNTAEQTCVHFHGNKAVAYLPVLLGELLTPRLYPAGVDSLTKWLDRDNGQVSPFALLWRGVSCGHDLSTGRRYCSQVGRRGSGDAGLGIGQFHISASFVGWFPSPSTSCTQGGVGSTRC